jgi:hypothetical protein
MARYAALRAAAGVQPASPAPESQLTLMRANVESYEVMPETCDRVLSCGPSIWVGRLGQVAESLHQPLCGTISKRLRSRSWGRKANTEHGALARAAAYPHGAPVITDNLMGYPKTETRACRFFGREEWLENSFKIFRPNPAAVICDSQPDNLPAVVQL